MDDQLSRRRLAKVIEAELGASLDELAELTNTAPDEIQKAFLEAAQRNDIYDAIDARRAAQAIAAGKDPTACHNEVCPENGEDYRCTQGACNCVFRMTEAPPCDPWLEEGYPSHAECVRMLQRAGLVTPDEFGHWNGTDFAFQSRAVRKLWGAYVDALHKLGLIPVLCEDQPDKGCPQCAEIRAVGACELHKLHEEA